MTQVENGGGGGQIRGLWEEMNGQVFSSVLMKPVWSVWVNPYIDLEWTTGSMHPKKQDLDVFNMSRTDLRMTKLEEPNCTSKLINGFSWYGCTRDYCEIKNHYVVLKWPLICQSMPFMTLTSFYCRWSLIHYYTTMHRSVRAVLIGQMSIKTIQYKCQSDCPRVSCARGKHSWMLANQ